MSFTKGLSFHHETNSVSQPTINNNISISNNNEASERFEVKVEQPVEQSVDVSHEVKIPNETEFLRKVLAIYMSQTLYWQNKYLILSPDELLEIIQTLLPGKSVVIVSNDLEPECCKDVPVKKIDVIWIDDNDEHSRANFKYAFSNLVSILEDYKISTKFVKLV